MSHASEARRQRRAIKRAGAVRAERIVIDGAAVKAARASGIDLVELVAYHVSAALEALDLGGADVLAHTVVTIGEHPDHVGDLTIEAKAAHLKPDVDDSDDGLLTGP